MCYDQMCESEGRKEKKPKINEVLGKLLHEIRALKEEVLRICGDAALIATTICGGTASEVPIGVGHNHHSGLCSLCCPRVHERYLHEMDPDQGLQFPGTHYK